MIEPRREEEPIFSRLSIDDFREGLIVGVKGYTSVRQPSTPYFYTENNRTHF